MRFRAHFDFTLDVQLEGAAASPQGRHPGVQTEGWLLRARCCSRMPGLSLLKGALRLLEA